MLKKRSRRKMADNKSQYSDIRCNTLMLMIRIIYLRYETILPSLFASVAAVIHRFGVIQLP